MIVSYICLNVCFFNFNNLNLQNHSPISILPPTLIPKNPFKIYLFLLATILAAILVFPATIFFAKLSSDSRLLASKSTQTQSHSREEKIPSSGL